MIFLVSELRAINKKRRVLMEKIYDKFKTKSRRTWPCTDKEKQYVKDVLRDEIWFNEEGKNND